MMIVLASLLAAAAAPHAQTVHSPVGRTAPAARKADGRSGAQPPFVRNASAALPICDVAMRRPRSADFLAEVSRAYSLSSGDAAALNKLCRAYSRSKLQQSQDVTAALRAARKASLAAAVFEGLDEGATASPPEMRGD